MRAIVVVLCFVPALAAAQDAPPQEGGNAVAATPPPIEPPREGDARPFAEDPSMAFGPDEKPGAAWMELGLYGTGGPDVHGVTANFTFGFSYRILSHLTLRALYPLMFGAGGPNLGALVPDQSALDSGNPYLGAEWEVVGEHVRLRFGGGLTIPLAPSDGTHFIDATLESAAAALHGGVDPWLYVANTFAIVARAHVENRHPLLGYFVLGADLALAPLIPVGDTTGQHTHFLIQAGFSAGVQIIRQLTAGVRFWLMEDPTDGGYLGSGDPVQSSLSIYAHSELDFMFLDAMLTMNLDTPSGFAFDPGKVWGVRITGGARF